MKTTAHLLALTIPAALLASLSASNDASACTSFLVTRGASADGSSMITYAADSHELYGELYYRAEGKYPAGTSTEVREWDTGKVLKTIPQVPETYRVVGNMNEHQVVIGETTFEGREELKNPEGGIDYGSLIYISLQRSKTAREAIKTIVQLAEEHGYASEGESFSIADPNEVWLMELIGKGKGSKGIIWVAMRVPDGYVTAHANMSRIRKFPRNDADNCMFAADIVSFARDKGWFSGKDEDFSFADTYSPATCADIRSCDSRVWAFYLRVAPSLKIPIDYVACKPGAQPLPLWVKPDAKLGPKDLMRAMRDHFEDTDYDMRKDVGAGPYAVPYRWRPMSWKADGKVYQHTRATATQQTGFSFVSQSRANLPGPIGGLLWFSVDDAASTVYVPMYMGINKVARPYAVGTGTLHKFSWDSAFWVFNWVANQAYSRYSDMIVDIQKVQGEFEDGFLAEQPKVEQKAAELYKTNPKGAQEYLTKYSEESSERVVTRWRQLGQDLLVKYMDGNVKGEDGKVLHPAYPEHWYRRISKDTGDLYVVGAARSASASASAVPAGSAAVYEPVPPKARTGCSTIAGGDSGTGWWGLVLALGLLRLRRG